VPIWVVATHFITMADIERDEHAGPVPDSAWHADGESRAEKGRVEVFNATRPGGLDGWTMDQDRYQAVHDLILDMIDNHADPDGTINLQTVVNAAQDRFGSHELFRKAGSPTTSATPRPTWKPAAKSNASHAPAPNASPAGATRGAHRLSAPAGSGTGMMRPITVTRLSAATVAYVPFGGTR
jgi:hypothetical protein